MKKHIKRFICIFIVIIAVINLLNKPLFAYYSATFRLAGNISTGSTGTKITNLELKSNESAWTEEEGTINSGTLSINTADVFSFTVENTGKNNIDYTLEIELSWQTGLNENGVLFIYPALIADDAIYHDILAGGENAIIGINNLDNSVLEDGSLGIKAVLDSNSLTALKSQNKFLSLDSSKNYEFKLFLFESLSITENPQLYHGNKIKINLLLFSDLSGKTTGWAEKINKAFTISAVIDNVYPLITEVPKNKEYFITEAGQINLTGFATASDPLEGDITDKIIISSIPEFNPNKADSYQITYNVSNSIGNNAVPLVITVVVWDFKKIASGNYHTLALTSHGKVYVWGYNAFGQLGDGTNTDRSTPKLLNGLDNIVDIAAGTGCSFALNADGQLYAWGRNENGRLGDNTTSAKNSPVRVVQPEGVKFIQVSASFSTAGAVSENGDVYTWGYAGYGAAGTGNTTENHIPTKINISDAILVTLGYYNGAAVTRDGSLYTWGDNLNGQLGRGSTGGTTAAPALVPYFNQQNIAIQSVSVGWYHMAAVSDTGELFTWGYGLEGRLGTGQDTTKNTPQKVLLPAPVKTATAGYYHTGVVTTSGEAYFFGQNAYGKHGSGNTTNHLSPVLLQGVPAITDISLALDSSFVLTGSEVYGMGYGGTGVLGTGNNNNSTTPKKWAFAP